MIEEKTEVMVKLGCEAEALRGLFFSRREETE